MKRARIIKNLKTILGLRLVKGGGAILQLSQEDKICAICFLKDSRMKKVDFNLPTTSPPLVTFCATPSYHDL